jgi:hypothetical protein
LLKGLKQFSCNFIYCVQGLIILIISCSKFVIIDLLKYLAIAPHLFLQATPFNIWMENVAFITFVKILFHFVTIVSNLSHALIVSRLATCSSFLALMSAKISSRSQFRWCDLWPWTYCTLELTFSWEVFFFFFSLFFFVGRSTSSLR